MTALHPSVESTGAAKVDDLRPLCGIGSLGRLVGWIRHRPTWTLCTLALVGLWTTELFLVQEHTLISANLVGPNFAMWAAKIRMLLDVLFVSTLVALFPRWLTAVLALGSSCIYLGLITYFEFFRRPLSFLTLLGNLKEGFAVRDAALAGIPTVAAVLLALAAVVKLVMLFVRPRSQSRQRARWSLSGGLIAAQVLLFPVCNWLSPLEKIATTSGVGRLGVLHGYVGAWGAEYYYLYLHEQAMLTAFNSQQLATDKLTPVESAIDVHDRLIVIQAESLDFNVLGFQANGVEVTPFLNRLREQSMFFRIRAAHFTGSCDADFTVLSGKRPAPNFIMYKVPGYKYDDALPAFLHRHGYTTHSLHGNTSRFYNRGPAFEQMGFDRIEFREQLETLPWAAPDGLGLPDDQVLRHSLHLLRSARSPTFQFIITLTTHTPYTYLSPQQEEIFPRASSGIERYLNSMRYLDNCLRDYVGALGKGATVMIYADHTTEVEGLGFQPDRDGIREFIPCFIYDTDHDLSQLQKTRGQAMARDGTLHLIDLITYLRRQVVESRRAEPKQPAAPRP